MKKKVFHRGIGQRKGNNSALSMLVVAIMFGCFAALAQAGSEPIATLEVYAAEIVFVPTGGAVNHMLTVKGNDGFYFQEEFGAEENPWLPLNTDAGFLPDGRYRYELRTQPDIGRDELEEAELAGDFRRIEEISRIVQKQVKVQGGSFLIEDGMVVLPEEDEDS